MNSFFSLISREKKKYKRVSLDTNVFIYFFGSRGEFSVRAKEIFQYIKDHNIQTVVSVMSLLELLSHPNISEDKVEEYSSFLEKTDEFNLREIDVEAARTAAFLRRKYGIKAPDASILACAIEGGAEMFVTRDKKLMQIEEIEVVSFT